MDNLSPGYPSCTPATSTVLEGAPPDCLLAQTRLLDCPSQHHHASLCIPLSSGCEHGGRARVLGGVQIHVC